MSKSDKQSAPAANPWAASANKRDFSAFYKKENELWRRSIAASKTSKNKNIVINPRDPRHNPFSTLEEQEKWKHRNVTIAR